MAGKSDAEQRLEEELIRKQAYIPDEPLRMLARMIAQDILQGQSYPQDVDTGLNSPTGKDNKKSKEGMVYVPETFPPREQRKWQQYKTEGGVRTE